MLDSRKVMVVVSKVFIALLDRFDAGLRRLAPLRSAIVR